MATEKHDLMIKTEDGILNIRVGAIIMTDGRFLMVKSDGFDYYYSVGGRLKFGETTEEAVIREVCEETGVSMDIDRLGFIQENFFYSDNPTHPGILIHEFSFFYYMKVPMDFNPISNSPTHDGAHDYLVWVEPDVKVKIFPEFFRTELSSQAREVKHYVNRT